MQGKSLNEMWKDYEKVLATVENWREQYKKNFLQMGLSMMKKNA